MREFRRIQAEVRKTIVLVTHDMREAFLLADRIGVLDDGRTGGLRPARERGASDDPRCRRVRDAASTDAACRDRRMNC